MEDLINKTKKTPIWLDLELRKDIDDYITLIYALQNNFNIKEVSIHNPSLNELCLLKGTIKQFKKNIPIIYSGEITVYPEGEDLHESLIDKVDKNLISNIFYCDLNTYLESENINNRTVFCGGSLFTISKILENKDIFINACIQGGYAGREIIGIENELKKFKKREKVPTWNLNLDLKASDYVMNAKNVKCNFISKNVCHASFVGLEDLSDEKTVFNETMSNYFAGSTRKKCLHDLLAFMTIFNEDIVQFKKVDLKRTEDERVKWYSEINKDSNKEISVSFDYSLFLKMVINNKLKNNKSNKLKNN
jgi:inosine-uridine nucleoside N-ribohydrolase